MLKWERGRKRAREQAGGSVLERGPVQGWGNVPAAHASDTLHTACLWSEFSGCGQCGGGRSGKGAGEEWMEGESEKDCLYYRAISRGGVRGKSLDWKCRYECEELWETLRVKEQTRVWVRVAEHMLASVCVIVCAYGGRLAEVDSLCLQSGFVVSHSLAIEVMAG